MSKSIYQFSAKDRAGKDVNLEDYKGKVVLVVNTASKCGLTPQLEGLQALYEKYSDQGLEILGFPCNQFANQEPEGGAHIEEVCLLNYGVKFPILDLVEVNGDNAHPLFKHLKKELPGTLGNRIKWNFTKFLVDQEGRPVKRFAPTTKPEKIDSYISDLL
ncbi:glutathione peroxidase [Sediminitomix flava]|uniref:Glutathione peroxidase n=1 Tax=Sediminitomix flava TaxID=379075 RepID=A0A315YWV9_SEDFL|nr:glutathione peroxidase [Sediminitomix flava]PWJ34133.1 glutathione peroxidase [Sediminitomix flava]